MGRAWGTNLYPGNPAILIAGSPIPMTAGVRTTLLQFGTTPLLIAGASGGWYLSVDITLAFLFGATPPSSLNIFLDFISGQGQDQYTVPPALFVANATVVVAMTLLSPNNGTIWFPTGENPQITATAGGQPITFQNVGSRGALKLLQGA